MKVWLGHEIAPCIEHEGVATLVEQWLRRFGPGTVADIKWWLGSTVAAVRKALADIGAVEVDLDGQAGFLMADDLEPVEPVESSGLPPSASRPDDDGLARARLVSRRVQAAALRHGGQRRTDRVIGQRADRRRVAPDRDGEVELQMLEDIGAEALDAIEREAGRLTDWLDGTRVLPRFPSPLSRELAKQ